MPAGRYHFFSEQRFTARCRSLKKRSRIREIFSVIMISGLALVFILSLLPLGAPIVFNLTSFQTVLDRCLQLDYLDLICHSLPGMNEAMEETGGASPGEALTELRMPVQANPGIFLHNELTGFKVSGTAGLSGSLSISDYEFDDDTGIVDDALQPEQGEEGISFLLDKRSENVREKPFGIKDDKPLVLIYHTHASESFIPVSGRAFTDDPKLTVVSLGDYLAQLLEKDHGISVLHHREVYDVPRDPAYGKARPAIERVLEQNPQIQVVLDLHRDGVSRQSTTANVAGKNTAKILFVIGTHHEGWYNNLRLALFLEKEMEEKYPGLSRGIKRFGFVYNQDLHPRSLIVEIGGHENNREEIMRAVSCFAAVLAAAFQ